MRCASCNADNPATAKFCEACGQKLGLACANCGHANRAGSRFCVECGHPLESRTRSIAGNARSIASLPSSPSSYTPPHLAEKILAARSAVAGERKQVTVFFADIKGSTELIQALDTEQAQQLLDGTVKVMMDAVHRYEGTVSHVLGDGIMALFGAPIAHEDHALRACYAALALQEGMRRYAEEVRRMYGALVEVRVGLNSGEVVVRLISDDLHMDYTATGQTVHLASRVEQLARAGTVLITAETLALVEGYLEVRAVGPAAVKGLDGPVELYELVGVGAARTRLQASALRGLTRFVGREAELAVIQTALERAKAGQGQLMALVGEPGVGKSRLVWEISRSHRTRDWLVLQSSSVSYGKATSWLPVIDLLKDYCGIGSRDDARTIRERVTGKLLTLDRTLETDIPALLSLFDVSDDDKPWRALDPPRRRRQTLDALKRLLLRESREQPLLLVFEDLHWIDLETQALLDSLIESLPSARLLLLVNYRPEYTHGWGGKTYFTQVRVDPFAGESAGALLDALLGTTRAADAADSGPLTTMDELKRFLIARTEGNPFFMEELVRTLIETGALVGERGAYALRGDITDLRMPVTVQAILAGRIDRLPPGDKELLQTMAVIGKDVPFALLRALTVEAEDPRERMTEEELSSALGRLQRAEFLYETSLFPQLEYTFKHALTHEVAYGSLLHERRKGLHARIVTAVETAYADRMGEYIERTAYHAERGELWDKALTYYRHAGMKGVARSANRAAVGFFERALAALDRLETSRETQELGVDLRLDIRQALLPLGEFKQILDHLREAETIAITLNDQQRLARILAWMAYSHFFTVGDHVRAIDTGRRALEIGRKQNDVLVQVIATFYLAYPHQQRGDLEQAVEGLKWIAATLRGKMIHERFGMAGYPAVLARALLAWCLADLGAFAEARRYADEAIDIAETIDQPWSLGVAQTYLGHFYLGQGDIARAIYLLEQCRALIERWDLPRLDSFASSLLGAAYAWDGRHSESLPLLENAKRQLQAGEAGSETRLAIPLIEGYLAVDRVDQALLLAERALSASQERHERGYEAHTLRLLGEIAARHHPLDAASAESRFRQASALAHALHMRPLMARCHLGLGKVLRRTGQLEEARTELSAAVEMLRAMEMGLWLPEAEAELAAAATAASSR